MSKPNVLVLGGVGFIGRNFVKWLVDKGVCGKIRVIDKVLPATAFLGKEHQDAFNHPSVEYKQGNLTSVPSIQKCLTLEDGGKFTYVFNLAAETKYGQTEEVYNEKVFDLTVKCATEAAKAGVERFVEVSTAQVYAAGSKASKETDKLSPWTNIAKFKLKAEEQLKAIPNLKYVVLRPVIVYGPGDSTGLAPRIICGAVYKHLNEKMKFLWGEDLRLNTVYVGDVCKALWHVATSPKVAPGSVYNLADKNDTNQEKINKHLEQIYGIKTGFLGSIASGLATSLSMKTITEEVNDKHLKPWSDLCKKAQITNTPLTPYLDPELLYNNALSCDGSAIEATGFVYDHPQLTTQDFRDMIDYYQKQKLFPPA
jgi:nucleoside-diphosphate-sugar epimerase